jgi:DHA3 family macrolide efflux protein-like MFS transporter
MEVFFMSYGRCVPCADGHLWNCTDYGQTASTTLLQENSTPEMSGRIFGLFSAAYSSFLPIGMIVFGLLADRTSLRLLMMVSGGLLILIAAVMFLDKSFYQHGSER